MDVYLYKTKGKNGYLYDISLNPQVDFEILKRTRNIDKLELITDRIPIEYAETVLRKLYNNKNILERLTSQDFTINRVLRKFGIKRVERFVVKSCIIPYQEDIEALESYITGRVTTLKGLLELKKDLGIKSNIVDIVQVLYCQRRIKMVPSVRSLKNKRICSFCRRESCPSCYLGFGSSDIMVYAADNYNVKNTRSATYKKRKMRNCAEKAFNDVMNFIKSKKQNAILWCVPHSFECSILVGAMAEVINRGGRVLYITSTFRVFETITALKENMEDINIGITRKQNINLNELDISACSYDDYPVFHKAFDLVILDKLGAFIEKPSPNIEYICQRAVKERGKLIIVTYNPDCKKSRALKSAPEVIVLPLSRSNKLIPEPRIVTSRYLRESDPFIPQMVTDIIKWSLNQEIGVMIFTPDEIYIKRVYDYLSSVEKINEGDIDISYNDDKLGLMRFKKKEAKILISIDFKDCQNVIEDVNVVIMHGDDERYDVDTLINMSAVPSFHSKDRVGEVVIAASSENDTISSAKSIIRSANKIAWERKYLKT